MKISIITAVYNRKYTILNAIDSIKNQTYPNIEHLIIDGDSKDGTLEIIENSMVPGAILISEPDSGIYDAINKGIKISTGDIIGILHSDDVYASSKILSSVAAHFSDENLDVLYADVEFFKNGNIDTIIRRYSSKHFNFKSLAWGWMPAHTSMFFRRRVFESIGLYKTDYKIAADMDLIARVFKSENFKSLYVPCVWVKMQIGGISTGGFKNRVLHNREILRALRENGIKTNILKILSRYFLKIFELSFLFFKK